MTALLKPVNTRWCPNTSDSWPVKKNVMHVDGSMLSGRVENGEKGRKGVSAVVAGDGHEAAQGKKLAEKMMR